MEYEQDNSLQPLKEFFAGPVRASVWRNAYRDLDGREETYHTVHIRRRYRTDEGDFGDSPYFGHDDLPQLAAVVQAAYAWLSVHDEAGPHHAQLGDGRATSPVLVGTADAL